MVAKTIYQHRQHQSIFFVLVYREIHNKHYKKFQIALYIMQKMEAELNACYTTSSKSNTTKIGVIFLRFLYIIQFQKK
jgi:hypothetical protein